MFVVQSLVTRVTQVVLSPLRISFRRLLIVLFPARELVVHQVLEAVPVFLIEGDTACVFVERAFIFVEPLECFQFARYCSVVGCTVIPWAPVLTRPLEYFQISFTGGVSHHILAPRAPVLSQPHQTVQSVLLGRFLGCAFIECAPRISFSHPLENVQVAAAFTQEPVQIA